MYLTTPTLSGGASGGTPVDTGSGEQTPNLDPNVGAKKEETTLLGANMSWLWVALAAGALFALVMDSSGSRKRR